MVAWNGWKSEWKARDSFLRSPKLVNRGFIDEEAMAQLSSQFPRGQYGTYSTAKFLEVSRGNRDYDSHYSSCSVLQELFDTFNHNSRLDILNSAEENTEYKFNSHLQEIWRSLGHNCGRVFESLLSCFAVQVSITLFRATYSWSQQLILVLNDLFVSDTPDEHWTRRTDFALGKVEVV